MSVVGREEPVNPVRQIDPNQTFAQI